MKHEYLAQALDEVQDNYIADAAKQKRKLRLLPWMGAVAAVLAVAILAVLPWQPRAAAPTTQSPNKPASSAAGNNVDPQPTAAEPIYQQPSAEHYAYALSMPEYPPLCGYPLLENMGDYDAWREDQNAMHDQPEGYADILQAYFADSTALLLGDTKGENAVCSPLNIYMALAMLAEVTDGESRQQLLDLLNAESIEALREQAGHVWRGHYNDDGLTTSILASSLWLDQEYTCKQETADLLAEAYYASVFSGDLGSEEMNRALRDWLNEQTGNLLQHHAQNIELDPRTALALSTTIYYKVAWTDAFQESANREETFHGTGGDTTEVFMNRQLTYGSYYWDEDFGAVALSLKDGSRMWLFLPDEGMTPEALMADGQIFNFLNSDSKNSKRLIVNLSIPKFDIDAQTDLNSQLQELGVTHVFQPGRADFSPILETYEGVFLGKTEHAARVAIDEDGIIAAAYTVLQAPGAGMPPEEEMDFVLNRPFAFIIESADGLPLFAGIVNQP